MRGRRGGVLSYRMSRLTTPVVVTLLRPTTSRIHSTARSFAVRGPHIGKREIVGIIFHHPKQTLHCRQVTSVLSDERSSLFPRSTGISCSNLLKRLKTDG